uniref:hypothetical protein n=1 Tax=Methanobrevibacter sp. TaxID=66852 RepID=UPI00388F7CAC
VTLLLLAILTIGAVSASEDISDIADASQDDTLAVEDAQEDLALNPSEKNIADDDADDVLSYDASDFNVKINESMDLADEYPAVTFNVPSDADGQIRVHTNYTSYILGFDPEYFDEPQLTLDDLQISSAGSYFINVTFVTTDNDEIYLASGTIDVTGTVSQSDFNGKITHSISTYQVDDEIFEVEGCPADGSIVVFVNGNKDYSKSVSAGQDVTIMDSDLSFYGVNGEYNILVKFNTTYGKAFTISEFELNYDVDTFYGHKSYSDHIAVTDTEIFEIDDCPYDGNLLVYVDGIMEYNKYVSKGGEISVYDSDLSFYDEKGIYDLSFEFNTTSGKIFEIVEFDLDYDIESSSGGSDLYIDLPNKVDFSSYLVYLAYISDKNNVTGTVTLSIDGKEFYNKELTGTQDYLFIKDNDLKGFDIGDYLGNHTVKLTYNNITESSDTQFIFEPYFIAPYELAVGESSCIVFKATYKSKGSAKLYNTVYNESNETYSPGTLIGTYSINGASTVVPLPALKTAGDNVFYMNYTIDGISDAGMIGIMASENSNQFTSSISASMIGVGDSVTLTVTGPKAGGIDFICDATPIKYYSLKNGTVQYTFSNLTLGKHVIGVSFDGLDESNLFYSNSFTITVTNESVPKQTDISNVNVVLTKTAFTYNGKVQKPTVTLTNGAVLKEGVDYTLDWSAASPKNVGTYTVTVTGIGAYNGTTKATFKINKAANPLAVKAKTVNVKFSAVKKKAQTLAVSKVITFTKKGQGTLTYAKASGNKKITINKKTGKVTVAKGLKKGTYKVKVKIKAAGNANYKASAYKTVTFKIVIK